jgi:hypothetical protein
LELVPENPDDSYLLRKHLEEASKMKRENESKSDPILSSVASDDNVSTKIDNPDQVEEAEIQKLLEESYSEEIRETDFDTDTSQDTNNTNDTNDTNNSKSFEDSNSTNLLDRSDDSIESLREVFNSPVKIKEDDHPITPLLLPSAAMLHSAQFRLPIQINTVEEAKQAITLGSLSLEDWSQIIHDLQATNSYKKTWQYEAWADKLQVLLNTKTLAQKLKEAVESMASIYNVRVKATILPTNEKYYDMLQLCIPVCCGVGHFPVSSITEFRVMTQDEFDSNIMTVVSPSFMEIVFTVSRNYLYYQGDFGSECRSYYEIKDFNDGIMSMLHNIYSILTKDGAPVPSINSVVSPTTMLDGTEHPTTASVILRNLYVQKKNEIDAILIATKYSAAELNMTTTLKYNEIHHLQRYLKEIEFRVSELEKSKSSAKEEQAISSPVS